MPRPKRPPTFFIAVLGLFAVVRGYNIALIVLAQYLTSIYILAPEKPLLTVLLDPQLFALVMATALTAAAGFIINNFYDDEKDRINRPQKYLLEHLLSLRTQGWLYVLLNVAALLAAAWVSWMAFLFFGFLSFPFGSTAAASNACFGSAMPLLPLWSFFLFLPLPFILKTFKPLFSIMHFISTCSSSFGTSSKTWETTGVIG
jgi:hypothetical protein